MDDTPPEEAQIERAVKGCDNGRTGGGSVMRAEDLKEWLRGAEREAKAKKDGEEGFKGLGDRWRLLVRLI